MMRSEWRVVACAAAFAACLLVPEGRSAAQERTLSRQMKLGIMFYERGEDGQAMDRFMDVLTRGDASERPLANEYINLISQRLNASGNAQQPGSPALPAQLTPDTPDDEPAPRVVSPKSGSRRVQAEAAPPAAPAAKPSREVPAGPEVVVEPEAPRMVSPEPKPRKRPVVEADEDSAKEAEAPQVRKPSREAVEKDIRAKIRAVYTRNLEKLRAAEEIQIALGPNGDPEAIGIPTAVLFQSGIAFKKTAKPLLEAVTGVIYGLKNAQLLILPEGASIGDPKVLDMRRTMGISAHLYAAGVSPGRVRVNLLTTQVEIPRPLKEFKGILLVFVYNKPLDLVVGGEAAHDSGPTVSLGVYPEKIDAASSEGSIIEFSVLEPPAGLASWRFRLLRPSEEEGEGLAPLNDVVGSGPVFHQIFWNGRKSYFGDPLPAGRYECVLTATDGKNRSRTLHRWITLSGSAVASSAPPSGRSRGTEGEIAVEKAASGPPPADLGAGGMGGSGLDSPETLVKGVTVGAAAPSKRPARSRKAKVKKKAKPAAAEDKGAAKEGTEGTAAPAEGGEAASADSGKSFELAFAANSSELSPDAEGTLDRVGEALGDDKKSSVEITGHATGAGLEAAALAKKRAGDAADRLMRKFGVPPERIVIRSSASDSDKVEIRLVETP